MMASLLVVAVTVADATVSAAAAASATAATAAVALFYSTGHHTLPGFIMVRISSYL